MKRLIKGLFATAVIVSLAGCQSTAPASFASPVTSILVLPASNESVDVEAPTQLLTTLPKLLGEHGYYVFPVHTVQTVLRGEGIVDGAEAEALPPALLADWFGADAVLYLTIHKWDTEFLIISANSVADVSYRLVDAQGEVLWEQRKLVTYNPNQNRQSSGNLFADLIVSAIAATVERAKPSMRPLARTAHTQALPALPKGPYASPAAAR